MSLLLLVVVFVTVVIGVFAFGAAAVTPSSVLGARLRALGGQQAAPVERPAIRERIEQALDPLSKAIPLSPTDVSRTRRWLIQAGFRDAPFDFDNNFCWDLDQRAGRIAQAAPRMFGELHCL